MAALCWTATVHVLLTVLSLCDRAWSGISPPTGPESFVINGVGYPAGELYEAVYIVSEFGEEVTISILCNHTRGFDTVWLVQFGGVGPSQPVPPTEESILVDNPIAMTTYYMVNQTLMFRNPAPEMEGIYSCVDGALRLQITLSNPYVRMSPIRPEGLDTLTLTAVALYTVGGEQSAPNLSDVTVTARDLGIELTVVSDSIPDPPDNPYETIYEVARPPNLFDDRIFLIVGIPDTPQRANDSRFLFIEGFFENLMPVTVVNEGDEVVLNCTASIPEEVATFQGPSIVLEASPPGDRVWNFTAIPSYSGRYSCSVRIETTIRQDTILVVIPVDRDVMFVDLDTNMQLPSSYILLNTDNRNIGCVTRSGSPFITSENDTITEFIAAVDTQGSISVGEDTLVVTKGDRYIDIHVQIQEAPMYGDTLKCKSDVLTDNAIIRIVPGNIYISRYPDNSSPASIAVTYGAEFTLRFIYVSAFPQEFALFFNGSPQKTLLPVDPVNNQIRSFSGVAMSNTGGEYVVQTFESSSPNASFVVEVIFPVLTITPPSIEVEVEDTFTLICTSSIPDIPLIWEFPGSTFEVPPENVFVTGGNITVSGANRLNEGDYLCEVVEGRTIVASSAPANVNVIHRCPEDFGGGILWRSTREEQVAPRPCRDADSRFSLAVVVTRVCDNRGVWLDPNFSGCTLSSGDPQVFVILSLNYFVNSDTDEEIRANEDFIKSELDSFTTPVLGEDPLSTSLVIVPGTVSTPDGRVISMRYTVTYNATEADGEDEGTASSLTEMLLCDTRILNEDLGSFDGDSYGFEQADFCECKVIVSPDDQQRKKRGVSCPYPFRGFQDLCNGTTAAPCVCTLFQCQCSDPYVGDGTLCALDIDGDSYPAQVPQIICEEDNTTSFCMMDSCPTVPNIEPDDSTPCDGFGEGVAACTAEMDDVWQIEWPFFAVGNTSVVPCGANFTGDASRVCGAGGVWNDPDVSNCSRRVFTMALMAIASLVLEGDVDGALEVFETTLVAATETDTAPLFPAEVNIAIETVDKTLTLLEDSMQLGNLNDSVAIFDVLDNLLEDVNRQSFVMLEETGGSERVLLNVERYALYVADVLQAGGETLSRNRTGDNIVLRAESVSLEVEQDMYGFPEAGEAEGLNVSSGSSASISIPRQLLMDRANGADSVSVAHILFRDLSSFLPNEDSDQSEPESLVISSQVADRGGTGEVVPALQDNPVIIIFSFEVDANIELTTDTVDCVFWDFGNDANNVTESRWSTDSVAAVELTREGNVVTVTCSSVHLTSFAVLVDVGGAQLDSEALRIVSYIGLAISLACLLLTIIFFLTFGKKLFTAVHNFVHLNLAIALFIGYLTFAVGVELAKDDEITCNAVAALIHYFLLSAFCWMMCEGVMLYLMLVVVFTKLKTKWWFFFLLGWGIPLIFVVIGLGAVRDEYGVTDEMGGYKYCWLSSGKGTYAIWLFVAPMLAIIIINTVFLVMVLYSVFKSRSNRQKRMDEGFKVDVVTSVVKASVILLPLLGLTWVFGLFAINENTAVFAWLFTIFNSLQGVFIFIFHVVRNDRVWGTFKKRYGVYTTSRASKSKGSTALKAKYHSAASSTAGMEMKDKQSFADPDASEVKTALDDDEPTKVALA